MYIKHGSPVKMMEAYVTVLTKGLCQTDENGSFLIKDYDIRKAYLAGSIKGEALQLMRSLIILFVDICLFLDNNNLIIIPLFHFLHLYVWKTVMNNYDLIIIWTEKLLAGNW